jgi:hypothetical protein
MSLFGISCVGSNTVVGTWSGESLGLNDEGQRQLLSVNLIISDDYSYIIQLSYNRDNWQNFIKGNASVDENNIILTATSVYNNEEARWIPNTQNSPTERYNFTGTSKGSKLNLNGIQLIKQ